MTLATLPQMHLPLGLTGELLLTKLFDGPLSMLGDHGISFTCHFFQIGDELLKSAIAHGNGDVTLQSGVFGALYRRSAKCAAVSFFIHLCELAQIRMVKLLLRLKLGQGSRERISSLVVPWANVLADIAAKDVVSHLRAKFFGNSAALFNREVSNTQPRIKPAGSDNRLGRACINAACATSTAIRRRSGRGKLQ